MHNYAAILRKEKVFKLQISPKMSVKASEQNSDGIIFLNI